MSDNKSVIFVEPENEIIKKNNEPDKGPIHIDDGENN